MKYFAYKAGSNCEYRSLSESELNGLLARIDEVRILRKKIKRLKKELDVIEDSCLHQYFYDEPGFPYDIRYCAICGKTELI